VVNASLNWASMVGIVLCVFALALLYLSNQKPGLSRGYDAILSIVCLLCGSILFFQGWRLDPILQFGQFLLAAIVIFLGYQNLKLRRTLATDKSEFFNDTPIRRNVSKAENKVSRALYESSEEATRNRSSYSNRDEIRGPKKCSFCGAPVN